MNEQEMTARLLSETEPRVPYSAPPAVEHLMIRLRKRRRTRRIVGTSLVATIGVLLITCAHVWNDTRQTELNQPGAAVASAEAQPATASRDPTQPDDVDQISESLGDVRVFAKVHQPIPIFDRQEGTEYIRHVGWIDSEEIVPVDLSRFSLEQQQSIESVLHENAPNPYFSL